MKWTSFIKNAINASIAYNTYNSNVNLDEINQSIQSFTSEFNSEMSQLNETLNKGFAMLSFELAIQSSIFKEALSVLKNKRKAEAEELKEFGINALRNGWVDDAIQDFKKSIEINRYDYQVYYLLSKCYFLLDDNYNQDLFLQQAFHYSSEDPSFRQYIGLDIVGRLISESKYDDAQEVINQLEALLQSNLSHTPLILSKIIISIYTKKITSDLLDWVDLAIESYDGQKPDRILMVLLVLSEKLDVENREKVIGRINLSKYAISLKSAQNLYFSLSNLEKILSLLDSVNLPNSFLRYTPKSVAEKYLPLYQLVPDYLKKIEISKERLKNISVENFKVLSFLETKLITVEDLILNRLQEILKEKTPDFDPYYESIQQPIELKNGDKILNQCILDNNEVVTLTYFKLIILDEKQQVFVYDLHDDIINLDKYRLSKDLYESFYLKDRLSEKLLLINKSGIGTYNNINLLLNRGIENAIFYMNLSGLNRYLNNLNVYLDIFLEVHKLESEKKDNSLHEPESPNSNDIIFLD